MSEEVESPFAILDTVGEETGDSTEATPAEVTTEEAPAEEAKPESTEGEEKKARDRQTGGRTGTQRRREEGGTRGRGTRTDRRGTTEAQGVHRQAQALGRREALGQKPHLPEQGVPGGVSGHSRSARLPHGIPGRRGLEGCGPDARRFL